MATNGPASGLLIIERILRDRDGIWDQIIEERDLERLTGQMLASSAVALACYGLVLGSFHSPLMALTSAVKLPLLFLVTLAICLPTLYLFNLVFGARLSVRQAVSLVMVGVTVTAMLSVAFAPISLFFLITAHDYAFFKVLNVAILTLTAFVGLRFLVGGMRALNDRQERSPAIATAPDNGGQPATVLVPAQVAAAGAEGGWQISETAPAPAAQPAPQPLPGPRLPVAASTERPASMTLLYVWILLFGFVGTQLAWTLRPFFGSPDSPYSLFRDIEGNFYAAILKTIGNLFS
jgi:hypothetical protein